MPSAFLCQRPAPLLALFAVAMTVALGAAGCSSPVDGVTPPSSEPSAPPSAGEEGEADEPSGVSTAGEHAATLMMAGQSFSFAPTLCAITDEDVLVSGPGFDDDSREPAFLDVDLFTLDSKRQGEVRIELGTDKPFDSRDEFFSAQLVEDGTIGVSGTERVTIDATFRFAGEESIGPGTLEVTCG